MTFLDLTNQHPRSIRSRSQVGVGNEYLRRAARCGLTELEGHKSSGTGKSKCQKVKVRRGAVVSVPADFHQGILSHREIPIYAQVSFDECNSMVHDHQPPNPFPI